MVSLSNHPAVERPYHKHRSDGVLVTSVPELTSGEVLGPVISADGMPIVKRWIPPF
jgi:hypothetical protein